ncbi:MAG: hypothetical protein IMF10_08110, partial [Proteobacteria bacterium]|nr:hypothetical protein [Pseudomonadota bacterium]
MLTHTWLLKKFIGAGHISRDNLDIFAYNVSPDFLPIHQSITPEMTHGIPRLSGLPRKYRKAAFVLFHLLVDDMAHHGRIGGENAVPGFNPNSNGYAYAKGRPLIRPIMDFHKELGEEISFGEAAYRSHLIIEMSFDLVLYRKDSTLTALLSEALNYTIENKLSEFSKTLAWIFDIRQEIVAEAINKGVTVYTKARFDNLMNVEGRICLYADKFRHDSDDDRICGGIKNLFSQGMDLVADHEVFLHTTLEAIKKSGFK